MALKPQRENNGQETWFGGLFSLYHLWISLVYHGQNFLNFFRIRCEFAALMGAKESLPVET